MQAHLKVVVRGSIEHEGTLSMGSIQRSAVPADANTHAFTQDIKPGTRGAVAHGTVPPRRIDAVNIGAPYAALHLRTNRAADSLSV